MELSQRRFGKLGGRNVWISLKVWMKLISFIILEAILIISHTLKKHYKISFRVIIYNIIEIIVINSIAKLLITSNSLTIKKNSY
jgi:hypothetical protein